MMELPWSIRDSISLYERMDASFHMLTELPVELPLRLPHLNYLNLSYNKLAALPESFSLLFHLKTLLLSHNLIQRLPASFIHLVKLEKLDISHNSLRELPEEIGTMESLKKLNVSNNKLKLIPMSLGTSENTVTILAVNNRMTFPPQKICNEGSEAIIRCLKRNCTNGVIISTKNDFNQFPRVRGNQVASAVVNPHSAQAQYIQTQTHTTNTPSRIKTPLLPPLGSSQLDALDLRDRIVGR
jgi:Leucine-rich repeat (LRR) protein